MAKDVRERMVAGASQLLATKGLQATSFGEVIELTDTPRGSIYHHFPGGKDELVLAALRQVADLVPPVPPQVTRLAQGRLAADARTVSDPLAPDRAVAD